LEEYTKVFDVRVKKTPDNVNLVMDNALKIRNLTGKTVEEKEFLMTLTVESPYDLTSRDLRT
jgi:hypothetical protein